jgi:hypothetical protein
MRRNLLSTIIAAALLPAGSLWAAPSFGNSAAPYLNQINEQAYLIHARADRLEACVRSGVRDCVNLTGYTAEMAEGAQKLLTLLDRVAAQPGATNDKRLQVEKMKNATAEVMAFTSNALGELETRATALHADNVFADTANIEALCDTIRGAAQGLASAR